MTDNKKYTPSILTNMAFWQSETWVTASTSIYNLDLRSEQELDYSPLKTAWILYKRRKEADTVLTMGARESLLYGLLCFITRQDSRQIMTEVFIDDVQNPSLVWKFKTWLYKCTGKRAIGILTNSSMEIETMSRRYGLPQNNFAYIPLNTTIADPRKIEQNDGYIFSAGRTLRDYTCLLEAVRDLEHHVHIVCGLSDLTDVDIPAHVHLHREVARKEYLHLLEGAAIVVLPLLPTERSTGQVVMLEAMALGKPVITSIAPGTIDHIEDGKSGRLLPPGDINGIREAIQNWIAHPEKAEACATQALEEVKAHFTIEHHAAYRLEAIRNLYNQDQRPRA